MTMQNATDKPFKVAFLGPAQQSIIVKDEHYGDQIAVARDLAIAMNKELKYLVSMGLEAVQLIDVLPPYTNDMWQIEMQNIMFDGVEAIKFWHVCYGSVDGQRDIFDNHATRGSTRSTRSATSPPTRCSASAWSTPRTCRWRRRSRLRPGSGARWR
jgi:methionine synthase II (cobalamin-independent)